MKVNYVPRKLTSFLPGEVQLGAQGQSPPTPETLAPLGQFQNLDPIRARQDFAANVLMEGSSTKPAEGGIGEGLARMAQAVFGGMMRHRADEDLKTAKSGNLEVMKDAFGQGDYISLLGSEDPVAQKLGAAVLEQKLKRKTGHYSTRPDGTEVWENDDGAPQVISRKDRPLVTDGKISKDGGDTWTDIPGFVANAKAIADAKRAPKVTKPDDSGKLPWERKW